MTRVVDNFWSFFNPEFQEVQACPKESDGRDICNRFNLKDKCVFNYLLYQTPLRSQVREDYTRFLKHYRAGYDLDKHTQKCKSGGRYRSP